MTALETLRSIIGAADSNDRDDVATRCALIAGLGIVFAMCPSAGEGGSIVAEPTVVDDSPSPELCALGRRRSDACQDCCLA